MNDIYIYKLYIYIHILYIHILIYTLKFIYIYIYIYYIVYIYMFLPFAQGCPILCMTFRTLSLSKNLLVYPIIVLPRLKVPETPVERCGQKPMICRSYLERETMGESHIYVSLPFGCFQKKLELARHSWIGCVRCIC